jgi:hypothetical protein
MGRHQIIEKLDKFLSKDPIDSEMETVYLLVEIRKILDHAYKKKTDFLVLRFYCDWIVHTDKSYHLDHIAPMVKNIYNDIKTQIEQSLYPLHGKPAIVESMYMDKLKEEMGDLFRKEGLPSELFEKDRWIGFISALVQVLTDQPILNPIAEVPRLVLTPSYPGCICGVVEFSQPITGYDGKKYGYYEFKNAY